MKNRWDLDRIVEVPPYSKLAQIYDEIMTHVDYMAWADFAAVIMTDYGLDSPTAENAPRLLECACGTGSVAIYLSLQGYLVDAFDTSPEMIEIASRKAVGMLNPPKWEIASFADIKMLSKYDAVLCLYDSVNYITDTRKLVEFLSSVKRVLRPKGLFLFDICTEYNSIMHFSEGFQKECIGDVLYRRVMKYDEQNRIQENQFYIYPEESGGDVFLERHLQKIYSIDEIRQYIAGVGFKLLEETDDINRRAPSEDALRVHFICISN